MGAKDCIGNEHQSTVQRNKLYFVYAVYHETVAMTTLGLTTGNPLGKYQVVQSWSGRDEACSQQGMISHRGFPLDEELRRKGNVDWGNSP